MLNQYAQAGVNYEKLDPFKLLCQQLAKETEENCLPYFRSSMETRGESAFGFLVPRGLPADSMIFHVEEGLGTKNLVADAMMKLTNSRHYYNAISKDTLAMMLNDLITLGASPLSVAMHLAVGSDAWFDNEERAKRIAQGWFEACMEAKVVWAGGETPALKDVINPETFVINGSAVGVLLNKKIFFLEIKSKQVMRS